MSTDIQDVPQLAIFICYVHVDINVKEEILLLLLKKKNSCA